ncbi:MAG: ankyrin repeat domain-containing protein [Leptospirales bacterium]
MKLLLKHGAKPHTENIIYHIALNNVKEVERLLNNGLDPNSTLGKSWITPLTKAAQWGRLEIGELLIRYGAKISNSKSSMNTPVLAACNNGHVDFLKLLVKNGAKFYNMANNLFAMLGDTPACMVFAVWKGHEKVVQYLIDRGLNFEHQRDYFIYIKTDKDGKQTYHVFKGDANVSAFHILKNKYTGVTRKSTDNMLGLAALYGRLNVVKVLLKNGATCKKTGQYYITPLLIAAKKKHKDIVTALLPYCNDVNETDWYNNSMRTVAGKLGWIDILKQIESKEFPEHRYSRYSKILMYSSLEYLQKKNRYKKLRECSLSIMPGNLALQIEKKSLYPVYGAFSKDRKTITFYLDAPKIDSIIKSDSSLPDTENFFDKKSKLIIKPRNVKFARLIPSCNKFKYDKSDKGVKSTLLAGNNKNIILTYFDKPAIIKGAYTQQTNNIYYFDIRIKKPGFHYLLDSIQEGRHTIKNIEMNDSDIVYSIVSVN